MALSKFPQAFKDARASGETEFEFNGKKYNTKYKEEIPAPAKKAPAPEAKQISSDPAKDTSKAPAEEKPYRSKNLTDLIGLSSNIKKPVNESTSAKQTSAAPAKTESNSDKKGIGPYNVGAGFGDYLSKTFTMEGRERARKENKEKFGMKSGGSVSSASKRADGIAQKGKTRGKMC